MATALAYWVSADMRRPYYVYIGLQDNGSWGGPSATRSNNGILNSDWFGIGGGDGFQTAVDPTDYNIVYTESQNGNTNRYDLRAERLAEHPPARPGGGRGTRAHAGRAAEGAAAGRTPAQLAQRRSSRNAAGAAGGGGRGGAPNVLNAGSGRSLPLQLEHAVPALAAQPEHHLARRQPAVQVVQPRRHVDRERGPDQADRSQHAVAMMGVPGNRTHAVEERRRDVLQHDHLAVGIAGHAAGVVWVGTDDGNVQVSRDGGATFTEVGKNLPGLPPNHYYWISRIDASHFDPGTAYVAVDGHRDNDLKPYLFVTRDYGQTFAEHRRQPAAVREHPGRPRGSEEPRPAVRRHRVRSLHLDRTAARAGRSS